MEHPKKNQCANTGQSKTVLSKNISNANIMKPPLKVEAALSAFLKRGTMNTFEANAEYGDTCLHTTVCDARKHGVTFSRNPEQVTNRIGRKSNCYEIYT